MEALVYISVTGIVGFIAGGILEAFTDVFSSSMDRLVKWISKHDSSICGFIREKFHLDETY